MVFSTGELLGVVYSLDYVNFKIGQSISIFRIKYSRSWTNLVRKNAISSVKEIFMPILHWCWIRKNVLHQLIIRLQQCPTYHYFCQRLLNQTLVLSIRQFTVSGLVMCSSTFEVFHGDGVHTFYMRSEIYFEKVRKDDERWISVISQSMWKRKLGLMNTYHEGLQIEFDQCRLPSLAGLRPGLRT